MSELLYDPARLGAALTDAGLDVLVLTTGPSVRYLTRFGKTGRSVAVVLREDPAHPRLAVPAVELDYLVEDLVPGLEVHAWGDFVRVGADTELNTRETLVAQAHDGRRTDLDRAGMVAHLIGTGGARIGFDVDPAAEPALVAALEGYEVVDASGLVPRLRTCKTPLEVDVGRSRELGGSVQTFDQWLSTNATKIPIE